MPNIKVIIPAYNEANSITNVIHDIPKIVDEIIVVNNKNKSIQKKEIFDVDFNFFCNNIN